MSAITDTAATPSQTGPEFPLIDQLNTQFGTEFRFWSSEELSAPEWSLRTLNISGVDTETLRSNLKKAKESLSPITQRLGLDRILMSVPILCDGRVCGVSAAVLRDVNPERLARSLAEQTIDGDRHRREVESRDDHLRLFTEQLGTSMEESTWLRSFADNLLYNSDGHAIEDIARRTFPVLREVLRAESVALVTTTAFNDPLPTCDNILFPVWSGPQQISHRLYAELVEVVAAGARENPLVWNFESLLRDARQIDRPSEIRSCLLVEIRNERHHFGWILALNKILPDYAVSETDAPATLGLDEFGSNEATLVQSTARMLANHASNLELFSQQQQLTLNVIRSMINVLDARDSYTCGHSDRVALMGRTIAAKLGLSAVEQARIHLSGLLHDVGKVAIPDAVLLKPDRLTVEEFAIIKEHPERGVEILKHIKQLHPVLPGVLHHHESWDSRGYPYQLAGEEIPLMARILAVADAYDAMTTNRPYRSGKTVETAIEILRDGAGRQWDPDIIPVFLEHHAEITAVASKWESHIADVLNPTAETAQGLMAALSETVAMKEGVLLYS